MALDNKISNIIGTKLPQWLLNQLDARSRQNSRDSRDNDNLLFIANKSAWVRVVSSINLTNQNDVNYFNRTVGNINSPEDLAKQFVLFGGTSKYINKNSYQLRSGIQKDGAYGILGNDEVQKYGYRPMPGITSVNIETQGRLGSVRSATINFKCWDKDQLDVIDALYFKLGFTMFVEWGNTYFYKASDPTKVISTELYSIDPFQDNLTKEDINIQIVKNIRETEGNYDGMLGIVTNFNFSLNQEGGFDCSLRLMALGVLGDAIKINNQGNLPNILQEEIKLLTNTLIQIEKNRLAKEAADAAAAAAKNAPPPPPKPLTVEELINQNLKYNQNLNIYEAALITYPSNVLQDIKNADVLIRDTAYGEVFVVRKLKGFIPLRNDLLSQTQIKFDGKSFFDVLNETKINIKDFQYSDNIWQQILSTGKALVESVSELFGGPDKDSKKNFQTRELITSYPSKNGLSYKLNIKSNMFAVTSDPNVLDVYYPISNDEFIDQLKNALSNPDNNYTIELDTEDVIAQQGAKSNDKVNIKIKFTIPFTRTVDVNETGQVDPATLKALPDKVVQRPVKFDLTTTIEFQDTRFIQNFSTPSSVIQPLDYAQKLASQNVTQGATQSTQSDPKTPSYTQIKQALDTQSTLELTLRTIQVHALTKAITNSQNDLAIGNKVYTLDIANPKDQNGGKTFLNQIFSNGIFTPFINDLIKDQDNPFSFLSWTKLIQEYEKDNISKDDRLKLQAKYGFATNLMAKKEPVSAFRFNNYKTLLTAYVVPYQINQEIYSGVNVNHPVYIPLGLLLMILNHNCTMYDSKTNTNQQTPMVYVDFSTEHNFCLSNAKQLSTNPWVTLIPFEGGFENYKAIFDDVVLDGSFIKPPSGSTEKLPLFNPEQEDKLSPQIPVFKFDGTDYNLYRGRVMNILLNVDYLVQLARNYSLKDENNSIYLKTFLEQILSDLNRYLGNINIFRLAYNDQANTFHIVDDQVVPCLAGEKQLVPDNTTSLPLYGKTSIAKSLEVKTEISSKLSNMLAISANADVKNKANLSVNGDPYGFVNTSYVDRYITNRTEITGSKIDTEMIKNSANQFNKTITDFYSTINPSEASVSHATNYFIERMSKIKNNDFATKAAAMIPVSVNFTTDGIAGMAMGQSFTVPNEILPYTYNTRVVQGQKGLGPDYVNKVGFVVVGLNHSLENNQWNTSVRANMIFLKDTSAFSGSVKLLQKKDEAFGVDPDNVQLNLNSPDPRNTIYNAANYPSVNAVGYSNIKFGQGGGSNPVQDKINPTLLNDINSAARNAGVTVTITTAVSGHPSLTTGNPSRHNYGNAVDIAIVDGVAVVDQNKIGPKVNKFVDQLIALGYKKNVEVGNQKAVLTYGFPQHDNHIHISSLV